MAVRQSTCTFPGSRLIRTVTSCSSTTAAPTVGGAYINRYTLMFDMLVPSPWSLTWLVPFFNTDPYNLSGNDADFYLYGDGSVGIADRSIPLPAL